MSQILPSLFRRAVLCRVVSRTAVLISPRSSYVPPNRALVAKSSFSNLAFVSKSLSTSCPASFYVTKQVYYTGTSEHDKKIGSSAGATNASNTKANRADRLKRAVKEYGAIVIVFHVCISLFTLGVSYAVVSSGVDVVGLLGKVGVGQSILESKVATGASTFVIAYAIHKLFAPVRMATTLAATPLIARYLRHIGFLKQPVSKV